MLAKFSGPVARSALLRIDIVMYNFSFSPLDTENIYFVSV